MTTNTAAPDAARQPNGAMPQAGLRIGDWVLDAQASRLHRGQREARLEPKVADLLVYLAGHPRQVVSREELEAAVWRGTVVGYDSVTGAVQKLRRALEDDRHHPRYIETLSKRGYRLIAPVQPAAPWRDGAVAPVQEAAGAPRGSWPSRKQWLDLLLLLLLISLSAAGLWLSRGPPSRPESAAAGASVTIAILPVGVLGAEAGTAAFVEAMDGATTADRPVVAVIAVDARFLDMPSAPDTDAPLPAPADLDQADGSQLGRPGVPPSHYNLKLGQVYYVLGRYADAAAAFRRGLASDPVSEQLHVWLAASLAAAGELDEARWEAEQVLLTNPDFTLGHMASGFTDSRAAWMPRLVERLREVGLSR